MRVLIVDSDWRFAQAAVKYLESHANLVVHHLNASHVVERARDWKPELVILAAELADPGVLESLHRLNERPAVLLTGWMDRYDIAWRVWQRGGDEFLMKPLLKSDELQLAIVTALENAAAGTRRRPAASA